MRLSGDETDQYNAVATINGIALDRIDWVDTAMARNAERYAVGDVLRVWDGPLLAPRLFRRLLEGRTT